MKNIPNPFWSNRSRKIWLLLIVIVLIILILIGYQLYNSENKVESFTADIVIDLIGSTIAALTAFYLWYYIFRVEPEKEIRVLSDNDISIELQKMMLNSKKFWYRGPSGLWNIKNSLPKKLNEIKKEKGVFDIFYYLPLPQVITGHHNYVSDNYPDCFEEPYRFLQGEVLLSCLFLNLLCHKYHKCNVKIVFLNFFPNVRLDVCEGAALMTRKNSPAVLLTKNGDLFKSIMEEIMSYEIASKSINVRDTNKIVKLNQKVNIHIIDSYVKELNNFGCQFVNFTKDEKEVLSEKINDTIRIW